MRAKLAINGLKANVIQNEIKELFVPIRSTYFQNLKCNIKKHIFYIILVDIPSGLISSVRNRGGDINSMGKIN